MQGDGDAEGPRLLGADGAHVKREIRIGFDSNFVRGWRFMVPKVAIGNVAALRTHPF